MHELIRNFFDSQAMLSDEEWGNFRDRLEERRFKKGEIILREGMVENYLSFIIRGSTRLFVSNDKGEEISVSFISENLFSASFGSFVLQKPSRVNVEALEDCLMLSMSYKNLQYLYSSSPTGERLGRINAELYSTHKENREIQLLTLSARERYQQLLETNPRLLNLVKLEHIATYLGITPQSLSRIRRSISTRGSIS
jgi:CRP-like cAMP-binding protein